MTIHISNNTTYYNDNLSRIKYCNKKYRTSGCYHLFKHSKPYCLFVSSWYEVLFFELLKWRISSENILTLQCLDARMHRKIWFRAAPKIWPHQMLSCKREYYSIGFCIVSSHKQVAGEQKYHPECFTCMSCEMFIGDGDTYTLVERTKLYW